MNKFFKAFATSIISLIIGLGAGIFFSTSAQDHKVFELRTYQATPGNLDNLHARFRDHTTRIFRKHGMEVVGYWSPISEEERDDTLVYLLSHDNQDAADASWQAFIADPEWEAVAEESNRNGQILGGIERKYMVATDYSPM
ncbi:MAG: NIPSNAP family protein, partial [Gammaproteobacteria bacterium]|nr:NIPSNAP family protein [Gammaproteobacteria bacterium]